MTMRVFGEVDGRPVHEVTLRSEAGAEAKVIGWGAVLRDLVVPAGEGRLQRVVLGLNSLEDYIRHSPYFGAIAGRYGNRIGEGRFRLGDRVHQAVAQRRPQQPARRRARLQSPALAARRIGQRLRRLDAPVPRRRPGLSRQPHGLLHLSARRPDAAGRADGGDRRGDAGQPLPALVFQSRRRAVDPGPQSAPCRRLLYADGRGADPDRGGEGGRRHAVTISARAVPCASPTKPASPPATISISCCGGIGSPRRGWTDGLWPMPRRWPRRRAASPWRSGPPSPACSSTTAG